MADKDEISWPYDHHPYLGIRLKTPSGEEYPLTNEELGMVDTGYSGGILLPRYLYEELGFNMWEEPELQEVTVADGGSGYMIVARGYILVPKLRSEPFPVRVNAWHGEEKDTDEILIGVKFIKRFKLLLDGPANKMRIL